MTDENDMALMALLKASAEVEPNLSTDLLRSTFTIQRRHQFDRDEMRALSMQELKTLLEAKIDQEDLK